MKFNRMPLESWFDKYQYQVTCNIGESAVTYRSLAEIGVDISDLRIRYGHHRGLPELRDLIAARYDGLTAENIVVTNGAAEALFSMAAYLLSPGDHVVVEHPNYASNIEVPRSLGCSVTLLPLDFDKQFQLDLTELESLVTPGTKLLSLAHPNNPTGAMVSEEELRLALDIAERASCHLLFDETYRELVYGDRLPTAASLSPNAVSISTLSKDFGLAGLRIGWLATKDMALLEGVTAVREQVSICNSALSEAIACEVLRRSDELLAPLRRHITANLDVVEGWIRRQAGLEWIRPEAGVVCLPRFSTAAVFDPESFFRLLVEKYGTFIIPGRCFEMDNRYFRLGFGGDLAELRLGLQRFGEALNEAESWSGPCRSASERESPQDGLGRVRLRGEQAKRVRPAGAQGDPQGTGGSR